MTTIYMPTDTYGNCLSVSPSHGGCGFEHQVGEDGTLECDFCAPFLMKFHGASPHRDGVALTPDEEKENEKLSIQGTKQMNAMVQAFATAVGQTTIQQAAPEVAETVAKAVSKPKAPKSIDEIGGVETAAMKKPRGRPRKVAE